jgi:RNA polymerase sigma-70 factor (ECF subfamily)
MSSLKPAVEDLIGAIAENRDRESFAMLFEYFGPRLKSYFLRHGAEPMRAEEWVQEAMLSVWDKAHTFDARRAAGSTWIYTIARNKRIDALRRDRMPEVPPHDPDVAVPEEFEGALDAARRIDVIRAAIDNLTPEQATAIRRVYFADETLSSISQETGVALGTVKSRVRLALQHLRRALRSVEGNE